MRKIKGKSYSSQGLMPPRDKASWRKRKYHIGKCYKCGIEFPYVRKYLMGSGKYRAYKPVCPRCLSKIDPKPTFIIDIKGEI